MLPIQNTAMMTATLTQAPAGSPPEQEPLAGLTAQRLQLNSQLSWTAQALDHVLVLVIAVDIREACTLTFTSNTGVVLTCDAGFASHAQRLHLPIPAHTSSLTVTTVGGEGDCWIVGENKNKSALEPHLFAVAPSTISERREQAMHSLRQRSLCQFSWMGGCVIDGLHALAQTEPSPDNTWQLALGKWLAHFIDGDQLHYQLPFGEPYDNAFLNIEATLPVAAIAAKDPQHPICDYAITMWNNKTLADGSIHDGHITAEASYTTAYPMAVIAAGRNDDTLRERALLQLRLRRQRLMVGDDIYLRHSDTYTFKNWARGITWYLLGLARTLDVLGPDSDPELATHLQERCQWVLGFQRDDGLWNNFFNEDGYRPDSSGSAGIATALVLAHKLGLADAGVIDVAQRTRAALDKLIQPDGFLASVAPNNKRGEKEQHTHRRTIEPFALGLYAQLVAALAPDTAQHD